MTAPPPSCRCGRRRRGDRAAGVAVLRCRRRSTARRLAAGLLAAAIVGRCPRYRHRSQALLIPGAVARVQRLSAPRCQGRGGGGTGRTALLRPFFIVVASAPDRRIWPSRGLADGLPQAGRFLPAGRGVGDRLCALRPNRPDPARPDREGVWIAVASHDPDRLGRHHSVRGPTPWPWPPALPVR